MNTVISTVDTILFILLAVGVLYLFVFALWSLRRGRERFPAAETHHRIIVLIPAYKEDKVIEATVHCVLAQDYSQDKYEVGVISDHMQEKTNGLLSRLPVRLFKAQYEDSSKAKALNLAVDSLGDTPYDIVAILDADNTVGPDFLREVNNAYDAGIMAMQAHRMAKNRNTDTAVLDAVSEEINNSVFRKGHVNLGFSSALIGSGMAFDYKWFRENIRRVSTAGEDKELEALLLRQGVYIGYLPYVDVYDEKTAKSGAFYRQRRRWLAAQFAALGQGLRDFPGALASGNYDYCDKLIQWMMPPRVLLLGAVGICAVASLLVDWTLSLKWWMLLLALLVALAMAVPDYLVDKKFKKAIRKIPFLGLMMAVNVFRTHGASKKFIHTEHSH